jgi:cyclopropane fatty-acyl-phospholipid synthase-like methyltransferase
MMSGKENNPRILLARLRAGDYAHPGETEAIDIFLTHLKTHAFRPLLHVLDVGCGRGGTAHYLKSTLPAARVYGIDRDEKAIAHAQAKYLDIDFTICDLMEIGVLSYETPFDLIYFFSVFYALSREQQQAALKKLAAHAQPGTILALCEYINVAQDPGFCLKDFSGISMNPPALPDLRGWLTEAGWEVIDVVDLNAEYQRWYSDFLEKLEARKEALLAEFTEEAYGRVASTFQEILARIKSKQWAGNIVYAKLSNTATVFGPLKSGPMSAEGDVATRSQSPFG